MKRTEKVLAGLKRIEVEGLETFDTRDIIAACDGPITGQQVWSALSLLYQNGYIGKVKPGRYFLKPEFKNMKGIKAASTPENPEQKPLFPELQVSHGEPEKEPEDAELPNRSVEVPNCLVLGRKFWVHAGAEKFKAVIVGPINVNTLDPENIENGDVIYQVRIEKIKKIKTRTTFTISD